MRKIIMFSVLLIIGLVLSQLLPGWLGNTYDYIANSVRILMMIGLAFIMIHVGFEFHIDKNNLSQYGWDYVVAFTAAFFPWVFVTFYFVFVLLPPETWATFDAWKETLLAGRFAAPTSAGVLFSMLVAAGLGSTWLFKKARILAIFDDLDTVLLMIPLKILMVGFAFQLGLIVVFMLVLLAVAYIWLHRIRMPVNWPWVLLYATVISFGSEIIYAWSELIDSSVPIHIEVLLPAFVLGCIARPAGNNDSEDIQSIENELHQVLSKKKEKRAATIISTVFMLLVGLSMPTLFDGPDAQHPSPTLESLHASAPAGVIDQQIIEEKKLRQNQVTITDSQPALPISELIFHVILVTIIINLGKMFPAFCYRREASWQHRLGVAICMWPRGEVGAGVLVLSLSYGIGGPIVTVAMLSLAVNITLTGVFIWIVKNYLLKF